jgi:hypothetical protein
MSLAFHIESKAALKRAPLVMALMATTMTALSASASAGVVLNTIDCEASLDAGGHVVEATGPIRCSQVERATIRVTVSQRTTGAVAEGRWRGLCRRTTRTWTAKRFVPHGSASFEAGRARACALAVTGRAERATDAKQWCRTIELTNENQ